ncbi:MAG: DNA primase small subunit domain-containing protein [Candidatus Hodarchaeota archaeon]
MSDEKYLKRIFQAYYKEKQADLPIISLFERREFGFIPFEKQIMNRHIGFTSPINLKKYFINNTPKHAYSSGSLFIRPENQDMQEKGYQGCDLIFDIDVDHFYTPCKEHHDVWYCKECSEIGKGMVENCPNCGKLKLKKLNWICEDCLNVAKNEIIKLIYNFLIPDFNIDIEKMKIAFSGHRGYHLKIEDERIRTLTSDERREIVDYVKGDNISFEIFGLQEKGGNIFGFSRETIGWPGKIINEIEKILGKSNLEIETILSDKRKFNLSQKLVENFINFKDNFYRIIKNNQNNNWTLVGFSLNTWYKFLKKLIKEIGIKIDVPVSIDVHRLIRYPGSLHGKTGFKVQELYPDELDSFNPLNESNEKLDPIVFKSEKEITQKMEIIEPEVPITKIKGETYGPYVQGEKIEVPHYFAVFLLCKGVAKTI